MLAMQYRKFGKLDYQVSALGFGTMRLPVDENRTVNEDEAVRMLRNAADRGVNYFDTAYTYHHGQSETVLGKALRDGYREKVLLADKSPIWLLKKPEDFDSLLDEQLSRLQTEYIDFYLLHALDKNSWRNTVLKMEILKRAEAAKQAGKIRHLGFSFHDDYEIFTEIVDGYDKWEFCQIQYNIIDVENQAGTKGVRYAASKGLGVVIMEPLLGGRLANPPREIKALYEKTGTAGTPVERALQWLWNQPEVSVVLSGMSSMQQAEENIEAAGRSRIGSLSETELNIIDLVRNSYKVRIPIPCTGCSYCMPCPNQVNIPRNFEAYNEGQMHDDINGARFEYNRFIKEENRAGSCVGCGTCEDRCPQKIKISEWMPKVHNALKQI